MRNFLLTLSLVCLSMGLNAQLSSGLSACYTLNGNADDAINGLNGTASNVTDTTDHNGISGGACSFDGSPSSHILLPDTSLLETAVLSVSAWVNPGATTQGYILFAANNSGVDNEALALFWNGAGFTFVKNSTAFFSQCTDTTTRAALQWYHVCGTVSTDSIKLYVNGALMAKAMANYAFEYGAGKRFVVAGTQEGFDLPFYGSLDNLRFYNRVLSASEVSDLNLTDPSCFPTAVSLSADQSLTHVYPNPSTQGIIYFDAPERMESYSITGISGAVVQEGACDGTNEIALHVPAGFYFLNLYDHKGRLTTSKLIVE